MNKVAKRAVVTLLAILVFLACVSSAAAANGKIYFPKKVFVGNENGDKVSRLVDIESKEKKFYLYADYTGDKIDGEVTLNDYDLYEVSFFDFPKSPRFDVVPTISGSVLSLRVDTSHFEQVLTKDNTKPLDPKKMLAPIWVNFQSNQSSETDIAAQGQVSLKIALVEQISGISSSDNTPTYTENIIRDVESQTITFTKTEEKEKSEPTGGCNLEGFGIYSILAIPSGILFRKVRVFQKNTKNTK
ncbi:hypothetical protein FACS1894187_05580 [Synergistales bacterium]|nr:hypothetical protein FACS1894187_05580 [Synergistales bacterium]